MKFNTTGVVTDIYSSDSGVVYFTLITRLGSFRFRSSAISFDDLQRFELQIVVVSGVVRGRLYKGSNVLELASWDKFEVVQSAK